MKTSAFFLSTILCLLLLSCSSDDEDTSTSLFLWFFIIFIVIFIIVGIISGNSDHNKALEQLEKEGKKFSDYKSLGMYIGGHPSINETKKGVYAYKDGENLSLYTQIIAGYDLPKIIPNSKIPIKDIKDISLEDASTIEKKITVGRLLLVGIFALAWKKSKKNESAFVAIIWTKGRFEQNTTFMFEGKDALQKANTARNELMELCI